MVFFFLFVIIINMSSLPASGLELPGLLTANVNTLTDVPGTMHFDISAALLETDRSSVDGTESVVYYILAPFNINGAIDISHSTTGQDDAYSMNAITVSSTQIPAADISFNLPSNGGVPVLAGSIDADDVSGQFLRSFPVTLSVSVDKNGHMTSIITITGDDAVATEAENHKKAQIVYWPAITSSTPPIDQDTPDILSAIVNVNDLYNEYTNDLIAINSLYNGIDMITDWTISFNAVSPDTNNTLSKHARHLDRPAAVPLFNAGEKLICATYYSYQVSINDYQGSPAPIIPTTNVYGVLQQI